nr:SPOR domain-containing protein [Desulfobulbaceae bacterium]
MKLIKAQSQNPKQLLKLFVGISIISFLLIIAICGLGIQSISKKANIKEAERDSVMFSKVFLEQEGNKLFSLLQKNSLENNVAPSPTPTLEKTSYSIQAGTFSLKSGSLKRYNELAAALAKKQIAMPVRVEKIGKYYTVRLGTFGDKSSAEAAQKNLSTLLEKPVVVLSAIQPDRILVSSNLVAESTPSEETLDPTSSEEYLRFDKEIRSILGKMSIVKIKIFSKDGIIKYSTDTAIVNIDDSKNLRLQDALKGKVNSSFNRKDSIQDVVGEKKNDLDVVETYLPVVNEHGEVIGAFEVY